MIKPATCPFRKRLSGQRGQTLAFVALLLVVLLGFAALAIDIGLLMVGKARLQVALDAACLAAAQDLPNTGTADLTFNQYIADNFEVSALFPAPQVQHSYSISPGGVALNTVTAQGTVVAPLHFARVLGMGTATIGARAAAMNMDPDLMLVIDRSGSMCDDYPGQGSGATCPLGYLWQPMTNVKNAAKAFVDRLSSETMMGIVSYNHNATLDVHLSYIGTQADAVKAGIDAIRPGGYTAIDAALNSANGELMSSGRPNPKVIVLITDGKPNYCSGVYVGYTQGGVCARAAAQSAANNGIIIITIAFGQRADQGLMAQIASIGNGAYYYAPDAAALEQAFQTIAETEFVRLVPILQQ